MQDEPPLKKLKLEMTAIETFKQTLEKTQILSELNGEKSITIGTHHGTFHCDEALATAMLKILEEYKDAAVIRTRDNEVLSQCTIVVDVGGVFDSAKLRFDHHQKTFTDVFGEPFTKVKLSSAGLVYRHYGKQIIKTLSKADLSESILEKIYLKIYKQFIQHIDGIDNGVNAFDGGNEVYQISTSLSSRVSHLNPDWTEEATSDKQCEYFKAAVLLTGQEFIQHVQQVLQSWLPARSIVDESFAKQGEYDSTGEILVLTKFCPYMGHIFDIETERSAIQGKLKYVIFPDSRRGYRVRTVPIAPGSFISRKKLPTPWLALRDAELSSMSGIDGCVFVHAAGFIGGNDTLEGALKMARFACSYSEDKAKQ